MSGWEDYDSGPFCRHWVELGECGLLCANCQHRCERHQDECIEDGCECEAWVEPSDEMLIVEAQK